MWRHYDVYMTSHRLDGPAIEHHTKSDRPIIGLLGRYSDREINRQRIVSKSEVYTLFYYKNRLSMTIPNEPSNTFYFLVLFSKFGPNRNNADFEKKRKKVNQWELDPETLYTLQTPRNVVFICVDFSHSSWWLNKMVLDTFSIFFGFIYSDFICFLCLPRLNFFSKLIFFTAKLEPRCSV